MEIRKRIRRKIRHIQERVFHSEPFLTTAKVCEILGVPNNFEDRIYTSVEYAIDAKPGCIALAWRYSFYPYYTSSPEKCEELADYAMEKGAALLLADRQIKDYPCIVVEGHPFEAYSKLNAAIRGQFWLKTVGITGSIGKTTTTGMVHAVLSHEYRTFANLHNANSARFAAKQIQKLSFKDEVYIQEIQEAPPAGVAGVISKMVQPQAVVVTLVGTSHMEEMGSQDRILESCMSVQEGMPERGLLILNADDPFQWGAKPVRRAVYYGIKNQEADYRAVNVRSTENCVTFDVVHRGRTTAVKLNCFGEHNVLNALAAFAVGKWAKMPDKAVAEGLANYRTTGIRQNLVERRGCRLYLDCYNAAAESMESSLNTLGTFPVEGNGKRIAVLGDIKETGKSDREIHQMVGRAAAVSAADVLICYGKSAGIIAETARSLTEIPVYHTADDAEMERILSEYAEPGNVILFKGSRVMALERFADRVFGTWFFEIDEDEERKMKKWSDDELTYRVFSDHAVVGAGENPGEIVLVPESVEGLPVTGIGYRAFMRKESRLKKIRLPDGVKNIRSQAFKNCSDLECIEMPKTVCYIAEDAFAGCAKLKICGPFGSYAEEYAKNAGISFEVI